MNAVFNARGLVLGFLTVLIGSASFTPIVVHAQDWDLVIANGPVIDAESGLDAVRNIGIRAGRIESITTEQLSGGTVLDAQGLVVAPGFIDLHVHGHDEENYRVKAMDGVTTALELEVVVDASTAGTPNGPGIR